MPRAIVGCLMLVLAAVATACGPDPVSTAARPLQLCGQTLNDTPAGAVMENAAEGPITVLTGTSGAGLYLQLAAGCGTGARISIPTGAATIASTATTHDGRLAGVGIHPLRSSFTITVTNAEGRTYPVTVTLS